MHENHPTVTIVAPLLAAVGFLSTGVRHLADAGLTLPTLAALLAGFGSILIGASGCSREVRGWYYGRAPRAPEV